MSPSQKDHGLSIRAHAENDFKMSTLTCGCRTAYRETAQWVPSRLPWRPHHPPGFWLTGLPQLLTQLDCGEQSSEQQLHMASATLASPKSELSRKRLFFLVKTILAEPNVTVQFSCYRKWKNACAKAILYIVSPIFYKLKYNNYTLSCENSIFRKGK